MSEPSEATAPARPAAFGGAIAALAQRLPPKARTITRQFAQVGVVGLGGLVIDVGVFNLLRWMFPEWGPIIPKIVSTALAILFNWLGNRYWTFRRERRREAAGEALEFIVISIGGSLIALGCLWFSHYVLGFRSQLADNISGNVVGLALGTLFRFTFYRAWVFSGVRGTRVAAADLDPIAETAD